MKCTFSDTANCQIFCQKTVIFAQRPKTIKQLLFFPKKTSKRSVYPVGCTFEKFWQKIHIKSPIIPLEFQKIWAKFLHSKEASQNCSSEHFESSFQSPAGIICLILQNFLLGVRKWFKKINFSTNFFLLFFRISRLFPWYPDFFVKR